MLYRLYRQSAEIRIYTEPFSRYRLPYRTGKSMKEQYPDGTFILIGEIGGRSPPPEHGDTLLTDDGKSIPVLPRGSLRGPFEWVAGYIPVGENTYITAVRSLFPFFFTAGKNVNPKNRGGK